MVMVTMTIDYMYIIIQAVNGDGNHDHWLHVYYYTGSQWWW